MTREMGKFTPNWLIVTRSNDKELFMASNIDDMLVTSAQYYGFDKPTLRMGLRGCRELEDKIEIYNTFSSSTSYEIKQLYQIGERLYG